MKSNPFEEQKRIAQEKIDVCEGGFIGMITGIALVLTSIILIPIFL